MAGSQINYQSFDTFSQPVQFPSGMQLNTTNVIVGAAPAGNQAGLANIAGALGFFSGAAGAGQLNGAFTPTGSLALGTTGAKNSGIATEASGLLSLGDTGTVTGAAGAETLNAQCGVVTTESVSLTANTVNAASTRTLTNNRINANSRIFVSILGGTYVGTGSQSLYPQVITPGSGTATIKFIPNTTASGTIIYAFWVL